MGKGPKQTFFQKRHINGQQVYEKMLNITNHWGNANQNHNEISLYTCQSGYHQKVRRQLVLVRCGEKGTLVHCWWECIGAATAENQKIKNRTTIWSNNSTPGYLSKGIEITILKKYLHSYVHCSIIYSSQDMETT